MSINYTTKQIAGYCPIVFRKPSPSNVKRALIGRLRGEYAAMHPTPHPLSPRGSSHSIAVTCLAGRITAKPPYLSLLEFQTSFARGLCVYNLFPLVQCQFPKLFIYTRSKGILRSCERSLRHPYDCCLLSAVADRRSLYMRPFKEQ